MQDTPRDDLPFDVEVVVDHDDVSRPSNAGCASVPAASHISATQMTFQAPASLELSPLHAA